MSIDSENSETKWLVGNYCVSFIDLLGQRDALRGQGLLPPFKSEEERKKLNGIISNSVGAIIKLQERAEEMMSEFLNPNLNSPLRACPASRAACRLGRDAAHTENGVGDVVD